MLGCDALEADADIRGRLDESLARLSDEALRWWERGPVGRRAVHGDGGGRVGSVQPRFFIQATGGIRRRRRGEAMGGGGCGGGRGRTWTCVRWAV